VSADTLILKIQILWGVNSRRQVNSCLRFGGGRWCHCRVMQVTFLQFLTLNIEVLAP